MEHGAAWSRTLHEFVRASDINNLVEGSDLADIVPGEKRLREHVTVAEWTCGPSGLVAEWTFSRGRKREDM